VHRFGGAQPSDVARGCFFLIDVVKCGERLHGCTVMKRRKVAMNTANSDTEASSVRATISFPSDVYATLDEIAKQKKVSLAWVVREAAEKYLEDKWPLLKGQG
jgi:hypothetical protein